MLVGDVAVVAVHWGGGRREGGARHRRRVGGYGWRASEGGEAHRCRAWCGPLNPRGPGHMFEGPAEPEGDEGRRRIR